MKKQFLVVFPIVVLTACHSTDNNIQLSVLKQQLANAIELLESDNKEVYGKMDQKLQDPQTKVKAEIWQPRAAQVKTYTNHIIGHIDSLIKILELQQRKIDNQEEITLYQLLIDYETKVKSAVKPEAFTDNPLFYKSLLQKRAELKLATFSGIVSDNDKQKQLSSYFINTTVLGTSTMLCKLKFDVLDYCHSMVSYFNSLTNSYNDTYTAFATITTMNSTYLKKGQPLIVCAGIGAIIISGKSQFIINGKNVSSNYEGVATDTLIIDKNPGDYSIPIKIEFTRPDGVMLTKTTVLKYTVAN